MPIDFTLQTFKSHIKDIARANRFTVSITNPWQGVKEYPIYTDVDAFTFYAYTAGIPQFDVEGPAFKYRGTHISLTGDYKREPISVSFWNDSEWKARSFFEDWLRSYVDFNEENQRRTITDYRFGTTITITQWSGATNKKISEYLYHDCSPLKVDGIELDQTNGNSIETFKVEFHYSKWERDSSVDDIIYDEEESVRHKLNERSLGSDSDEEQSRHKPTDFLGT